MHHICLAGHTGIKVTKILTKVMMLRLLLTTGPAAGAKVECLVVMMAGTGLQSAQKEWLDSANRLSCIDRGLA
jgi:hypothetical protein